MLATDQGRAWLVLVAKNSLGDNWSQGLLGVTVALSRRSNRWVRIPLGPLSLGVIELESKGVMTIRLLYGRFLGFVVARDTVMMSYPSESSATLGGWR